MNLLLRLLPLIMGIGVVYVVAINLIRFDPLLKFAIASCVIACLGYAFTWVNIKTMRRTGTLTGNIVLRPNKYGYLLLIFGALGAGYGFAINNRVIILLSLLPLWFADDFLTRTARIAIEDDLQKSDRIGSDEAKIEGALMNAIEKQRESDPLIGIRIGSNEIYQRLLKRMKNEKGVHVESLLCALGALGGYACQASLRAQVLAKGLPEKAALVTVETNDGKRFFFGDHLNQPLAESKLSFWTFAAAAAKRNGAENLPDINEIFSHVTKSVGNPSFGIPRYALGHNAGDQPINYLKALWPVLFPLVKKFCPNPEEWPILFGVAAQQAIDASKSVLKPELAASILMESAIPMSKVDLSSA